VTEPNILDGLQPLAVPIGDVHSMTGNPRRGDVEAVAASLAQFGQHKPIVVQRASGEILIGNHTWRAAKSLGWDRIAVLYTDDDRKTAVARSLADNHSSDKGTYDNRELAMLVAEIADEDDDLVKAAGFAGDELDALLALANVDIDTGEPKPDTPKVSKVESTTERSGDQASDVAASAGEMKRTESMQVDRPDVARGTAELFVGDCRDVLATYPDNTFHACITDPLGGATEVNRVDPADFDSGWWKYVPGVEFWTEIRRVCKPGAYLMIAAGTGTWHRIAVAAEEAGWELRDTIMWLHARGMPMGLDIGQQVDKLQGGPGDPYFRKLASMTDEQREAWKEQHGDSNPWYGWSTGLKPAWKPILAVRKPFNLVYPDEELEELHHGLARLLWESLSTAKRAEALSTCPLPDSDVGACVSALASAAIPLSRDPSGPTDTFNSPETAATCWSIVTSWNSILDALLDPQNTSTTSTATALTTALRTLKSCLLPITSLTTTGPCECCRLGREFIVSGVASSLTAGRSGSNATPPGSVPSTAIEGIALIVQSVLAKAAAESSRGQGNGSSVQDRATTNTATRAGQSGGDLTPAWKPILMMRNRLQGGSAVKNLLKNETGAINLDESRVPVTEAREAISSWKGENSGEHGYGVSKQRIVTGETTLGRWPANLVLDDVVGEELGDASRYFYCAPASQSERHAGLPPGMKNDQPKVRPLALFEWIVKMVTPPGGVVLDPFMGSGTTGMAATDHGFGFVGIDKNEHWVNDIARHRIAHDRAEAERVKAEKAAKKKSARRKR